MSTTLYDAAQIRLAETPPPACAACNGQYPERRHVDFGASYDGPVLDGAKAMQIDDLIVCEECLSAAAALIGTSPEQIERERQAKERAENTAQRLAGALDYIAKLEAAVAAKPTPKRKG